MLVLCTSLGLFGLVAYLGGEDRLINGANFSISVVTLLLLPILQATQNRDGAALQAKIDELIKATADARDDMIGLEKRSEAEIEAMRLEDSSAKPNKKREALSLVPGRPA